MTSKCKYCQEEIEWRQDAVTLKKYPVNPATGTPHKCMNKGEVQHGMDKEREEYNKKAAAAGFKQASSIPQEYKAPCVSPNNPAPAQELKTVEGQIVGIDYDMHKINVKDREGVQHIMIWRPPMHEQMCKLKLWWFTKITGEYQADVDVWALTAQEFFKRPEDWPFQKPAAKGNYQPRNEKLIAFLALHRDAMQGVPILSEQDYDAVMDMVYDRAKKDTEQAFKDFGSAP